MKGRFFKLITYDPSLLGHRNTLLKRSAYKKYWVF